MTGRVSSTCNVSSKREKPLPVPESKSRTEDSDLRGSNHSGFRTDVFRLVRRFTERVRTQVRVTDLPEGLQ